MIDDCLLNRGKVTAMDLGIDGWAQDFGEAIEVGMQFANGQLGEAMHNQYPVLYHRATREAVDRYQAAHPDREIWFFTRSGFSGSASYEGGNFPGDNSGDFGRANGLGSSAPDMLNRGIGGAYGFVNQIGGYFDTPPVTKEAFLRWTEWAALSPVFLVHNRFLFGTVHAWSFNDDSVVTTFKKYLDLHKRAAPLILRLWQEAHATGMPIARPLWLVYPGDAKAAQQDQEWLLGPDVLVAPVVTAGATTREVYFPAGCWADPSGGVTRNGPVTQTVAAPVDTLPYFVRCGTTPF